MRVQELKGLRSLRALNSFSALMLGIKMLPAYMSEDYEDFVERVQAMEPADQELIIRQSVQFVPLNKEDLEAIICFCTDKNGVPYGPHNMNNLSLEEIYEAVVQVTLAITRIKIDFVSEAEKKNLKISQ